MKYSRLAFVFVAAALCALRAQDDQQQQKPPTEVPDFNNLDEYIYIPKSNLNYGYRYTSGVRAHFSGHGYIASPENITDHTSSNIPRTYHDGTVGQDQRSLGEDLGNGTSAGELVNAADGKTNSWSYTDASQVTPDGFLALHTYSANTDDASTFNKQGKGNAGMEVFVSHDMKKLAHKLEWKLFGGMAINDIQAATFVTVNAKLNTTTDTYDLFGATPPGPGSFPGTATINVVDSNGNQVTDSTGTAVTQTVSTSPLLSSAPLTTTTATGVELANSITEHFKLHGAYATFRAGPQLMYDFSDHLKLSLSAGPALIFAGSTLEADAVLLPPTGDQIVDTITNTTNKLLLGYYVDATLQYDLTDRTGFYFGAFDQSAGSYKQTASSTGGVYTTKVDFDNQDGFRTGLSYKF